MFNATVANVGRRYGFVGLALLLILCVNIAFAPTGVHARSSSSSNSSYNQPTWWAKYQRLLQGTSSSSSRTKPLSVGANVDMSNEDTPQSETSVTVNPNNPKDARRRL